MADTAIKITTAGKEYKPKTADLLAVIFRDDPVIRFMLCSLTQQQRDAYIKEWFQTVLQAAAVNDAIFQEADNWSSVAVWMKPGKKVVSFVTFIQPAFIQTLFKLGFGGLKRMLVDFSSATDAIKARQLKARGIKRFYYLFFIGTVDEQQGRGLAKIVVKRWQEKCLQEGGVPIWLEATTPKSRDVYLKCGFEVVEELVMGAGTHDARGEFAEGGEGVRLWAMLWNPNSKESSSANA
ncbi:putative N-acetyltransferase [Cercospora beticola]|uniref:Putative N-acetyltransferase n=1 Tax=Cercospora beticola TaxID=122368 RepID=A0A2G5HEE4_CERBT|nr:putative N-acetyltransferase [Cercospora beticola]PIA90920.1 putative N-acetyltransferase [Cercospora beticola]WPB08122.1 hypothetical protein RHO25_012786 [Cercospora beticola]